MIVCHVVMCFLILLTVNGNNQVNGACSCVNVISEEDKLNGILVFYSLAEKYLIIIPTFQLYSVEYLFDSILQILHTHPPFYSTNNHPTSLPQHHWCWYTVFKMTPILTNSTFKASDLTYYLRSSTIKSSSSSFTNIFAMHRDMVTPPQWAHAFSS